MREALTGIATMACMVILFFLMVRTGNTHPSRRILFVSMGALFLERTAFLQTDSLVPQLVIRCSPGAK
jgi:hypothetical protein